MALLGRIGRRELAAVLLAVAALSLCAGCVLIERLRFADTRGLVFSHRLHVQDEELACLNCHEDSSVRSEPGMPVFDGCDVCHVDIDEAKPEERRIDALFDADDRFIAARVAQLDGEVIFDHLVHVRAVDDCAACHTDIEETDGIDSSLAVDMDSCMECHAARNQPNECATCHADVDRDWAPDNHHHNWTLRHGVFSRGGDRDVVTRCDLCHTESTCVQCHMVEVPENHDTTFRRRTHGIFARMDRQTCAACHDSVTCERCHADVLPLNHTGLFGGTRNTHCGTCHLPLQNSGCVTCHKSTASHLLGPPQPSWHTPTLNCRSCHGTTLPLSHVDNGSNCNLCHA